MATLGVIFPSFVVIIMLAKFISLSSGVLWFQKALKGVNIAVATLLSRAFFSISRKTIIDVATFFIFLFSFVTIAFFDISGFYVIIVSGILGYVISTIKEKRKK